MYSNESVQHTAHSHGGLEYTLDGSFAICQIAHRPLPSTRYTATMPRDYWGLGNGSGLSLPSDQCTLFRDAIRYQEGLKTRVQPNLVVLPAIQRTRIA
jgi:hypothetical protein